MTSTPAILARFVSLVALVAALTPAGFAADKPDKLGEEVKEARALFEKRDPSIKGLFKEARGYALFPGVAKGAIGIGGAHGTGQVFERGRLVGTTSLSQATIGFQLGGQVYAEVIFFETEKTLENFQQGGFALAAQVSAVAAAEGASANAKYQHGVAVFTLAKGGLMYEASVGGQKFSYKPLP
ncbi:hypothetical protein HQ590_14580 [bacterium]|nr:hypothetical protein [bacterium]